MSYAYQPEATDRDKRLDLRNIERNITITESDKKRLEQKRDEAALQKRRLLEQRRKLDMTIGENEDQVKKIGRDLYMVEEELKRLKKRQSEIKR